ncbi:MAG TPA: hypothetical protein VGO76_15325 [Luteibacter sp.]|nr:hypothetical protein [Luteibacter sp.]
MFKRNLIVACVVLGLAGATAWACGPMFPSQLLDDRAGTLKAVPANSFAFEAAHLLPATDTLKAVESDASSGSDDREIAATAQGITAAQLDRVAALRESATGSVAYDDGKDLPEDLRLYVAGAVDFLGGHCVSTEDAGASTGDTAPAHCAHGDADSINRAVASFEKVLALPPEQAKLRAVWAAYMLGRIHADRADAAASDADTFKRERDAAAKAFQTARERAVAGASDTQGLAVASFGEEARLYLYSNGVQCSWANLNDDTNTCGAGIAVADLKRAITLYAAQAGHGSESAGQSLATLAGNILHDGQRVAELVDTPVPQKLLMAYALERADGESVDETIDVDGKPKAPKVDPVLAVLVDAIVKQGPDHLAAVDRLAVLTYQIGRYDQAAILLDKASGPLASWVRAKLALQKGDMAAAAAAYAEAARAFPKADDPKASIEPDNVPMITGEQGVLSLARGEYVEAMGHLYDAAVASGGDGNNYGEDEVGIGYGNDAAYVAERVLTVDELKTFVDAHAPASTPPPKPANKDEYYQRPPIADNLRWLLARRLMRTGRFDEALGYFPATGDTRFGPVDLRAKAGEYAKDVHDGEHVWSDIGKAKARYAAAAIARENGMELLGYEQDPDFTDNGGSFPGGSGHTADDLKKDTLVTPGERQRFADSGANPDRRFHYRYIAVDHASASADLLPRRSQAFAAVLCKATGWMEDGPDGDGEDDNGKPILGEQNKRIQALYGRYVKEGPYVGWADDFGQNCEEPDFEAAAKLQRAQRIAAARHAVRRYGPYAAGGFVVLLAGGIVWYRRRRRFAR